MLLLYLFLVQSGSAQRGRQLQQADRAITRSEPVSATTADLVNDPTGRGHLLVGKARVPAQAGATLIPCTLELVAIAAAADQA